jgi:hypothetical protein
LQVSGEAPTQGEPWVLVTILFDRPVDPSSAESRALFQSIRQAVHFSLDKP